MFLGIGGSGLNDNGASDDEDDNDDLSSFKIMYRHRHSKGK